MIENLNVEAWDRWKAYRVAIRKPIKPASEHAMQLALARFGADQAEVVNQSISNQWQGLFDLKRAKPAPGEKPKKSAEQLTADAAAWEYHIRAAERSWNEKIQDPFGRLKLCEALWSRYTCEPGPEIEDKLEWLKGVIAKNLKEASAKSVLDDPHLRTMVWCFFGASGIRRLQDRSA